MWLKQVILPVSTTSVYVHSTFRGLVNEAVYRTRDVVRDVDTVGHLRSKNTLPRITLRARDEYAADEGLEACQSLAMHRMGGKTAARCP